MFPEDHRGVPTDFIIGKCSSEECITIPIHDDMMLENVESFNVILERTTDLNERITLHNDYVYKNVFIVDDDGESL